VNMEDEQECSKIYYDKTAKERSFLTGDKVMVYFPNAPPRINPNFFSHWVPYTVVQMVGKVNAQVRNKEPRKSSIILWDRIKELREDLEENEETAGMQQGQQQAMRARPKVATHAKENAGEQHEEARVVRGTAGAAVLTQKQDMQEEHEGARVARGPAGAAAAVLAKD
jgi:glutamyl-tRNA reductase